jgi:hypothetical protein
VRREATVRMEMSPSLSKRLRVRCEIVPVLLTGLQPERSMLGPRAVLIASSEFVAPGAT